MVSSKVTRVLPFVKAKGFTVLSLAICFFVAERAFAQTPTAFTCQTGVSYVTKTAAAANTNTGLYSFNPTTGVYTAIAEPILAGSTVNAAGYNPVDNFVWGAIGATNSVIKIGSNGQTESFAVTGLPVATYEAGDIDAAGNLYLYSGSGTSIYKINLATPTPTLVTTFAYSAASNFGDFDVSPDGSTIRAIRGNSDLVTITLSGTTASQVVTTMNIPASISYNMFRDAGGNLFAQNRTNGNFYLISAPHYNFAQQVQTGAGGVFNSDGASCPSVTLMGPLTPFSCTNLLYQVTATSAAVNSTLWQYNPILATRTSIAVLPGYVNAIGYNPVDNMIWGFSGSGTIAKIDATGKWVQYKIPGLSTTVDYHVGDVSPNGYFFIYSSGQSNYFVIDINSSRSTYLQLVNPLTGYTAYETDPVEGPIVPSRTISDWAFNPADNQLYAVTDPDAANPYRLVKLNPITGVSTLSATAINGGGFQATTTAYGANFFDSEGNFYVVSNTTGLFFRVDLTTNIATRVSATGTGVQFNDGAACANALAILTDLGDAPDSYGTLYNTNGAVHIISSNLLIGINVDDELDGQPTADANGDDLNGVPNDEDGVSTIPELTSGTTSYSLTVRVLNSTGTAATLAGWVDFNGNGSFQPAERAQVSVPNGVTSVVISWTGITGVVAGTNNSIRLRLASNAGEIALPTGPASNGEVEDYRVGITPLPVKLAKFSVEKVEKSSLLSWQTTHEANSDLFQIERSKNAKSWNHIGEISASGESNITVMYQFSDITPMTGPNYYRLKMVDLDGSYAYSQILGIRFDKAARELKIYPNPATGFLTIDDIDMASVREVSVTDSKGNVIYKSEKASSPLSARINLEGISSGVYALTVTYLDGSRSTNKVVVSP